MFRHKFTNFIAILNKTNTCPIIQTLKKHTNSKYKPQNKKQKNASKSADYFQMSSLNDGRGGTLRKFRFPNNQTENNFIFKGKSNQYMHGLKESISEQDPQETFEMEKDLDLYSRDEGLYHKQIIEKDIKKVLTNI